MDQQKDKINRKKKTKQSVVSCGHNKEVVPVKRIDCSCVSRQFSRTGIKQLVTFKGF